MYLIHKWKEKVDQLFLKQPLVWSNLLSQLATQSMQEYLDGRKQTLPYANPPFSSCITCRACIWCPCSSTYPGSSKCTSSGGGTCTVSSFKVRAFRSCSSLMQAWSVPLASTLKLSRIFLCLFIPWICFKRQALNSEMAARVFRARLHQQLIRTGLIFSAPIWSKFLSSSRNQVIFS